MKPNVAESLMPKMNSAFFFSISNSRLDRFDNGSKHGLEINGPTNDSKIEQRKSFSTQSFFILMGHASVVMSMQMMAILLEVDDVSCFEVS